MQQVTGNRIFEALCQMDNLVWQLDVLGQCDYGSENAKLWEVAALERDQRREP